MEKIMVGCIPLGALQTNCYFLHREFDSHIIVIDPGDEGEKLFLKFLGKGMIVDAVLLTHGHFDHIGGAEKLRELSGAKVYGSAMEAKLCQDTNLNCSAETGKPCTIALDVLLHDKEKLNIAGIELEMFDTPGHTGGSCCYYVSESGLLFSGDTLFEEGVGRTDFPTGNARVLVRSIEERLFVLPDKTTVYPGHGDFTEIGHEKKYNPYL